MSSGGKNENNDIKFQTGIGPMTDRILNTILEMVTADKFKEKITDKVVYPVTEIINDKIKPYIYMAAGLYCVLIVLLIVIIYLLISARKHNN